MRRVRTLVVLRSKQALDAEGARALAGALSHEKSRVEELLMGGHDVGVDGARALGHAVRASETLTRLAVGHEEFGDEALEALLGFHDEPERGLGLGKTLRALDLEWRSLGPRGAAALARAPPARALTELNLARNKLGDEGVEALARSLPPSLKLLSLADNNLGPRAAQALAAAVPLLNKGAGLDYLVMRSNPGLGPLGVAALADVPAHVLDVEGCGATDEGAAKLAKGLPRSKLSLADNGITSNGARAVAQALLRQRNHAAERVELHSLSLANNSIGSEGLAALAQALEAALAGTCIHWLDVSRANADDVPPSLLNRSLVAKISLLGNSLSPTGAQNVISALRSDAPSLPLPLTELSLTGTGAHMAALFPALFHVLESHASLTVLELGGFDMTSADLDALRVLREKNPRLDVAYDNREKDENDVAATTSTPNSAV